MDTVPKGNSLLYCIKSRRSIRRFDKKDVPLQHLFTILEAATWAPSGGNKQPWVFVVVRKRSNTQKVKLFSPGLRGSPAALVVVCNRTPGGTTSIMDISMAAQNAILEAYDLGLGSCIVRSFDQRAISMLLDLPHGIVPELIISLGYPAETPSVPSRLCLEEVTHWERYGGTLEFGGK